MKFEPVKSKPFSYINTFVVELTHRCISDEIGTTLNIARMYFPLEQKILLEDFMEMLKIILGIRPEYATSYTYTLASLRDYGRNFLKKSWDELWWKYSELLLGGADPDYDIPELSHVRLYFYNENGIRIKMNILNDDDTEFFKS